MQLEELQRVREAERTTDSLQHLEDHFYTEVGTYLDELRERRDSLAAAAADPFDDPEVRAVADEATTATRIVESLYERRVGKIVKLASFAAADMHAETDGLTTEEHQLFAAIVSAIKENRQDVLAILDDESDVSAPPIVEGAAESGVPETSEKGDREAETDVGGSPTDSPESMRGTPDGEIDRTTVRIVEDVGEIVGVDECAYDLLADDVVSLPTDNARPLIERGVADTVE